MDQWPRLLVSSVLLGGCGEEPPSLKFRPPRPAETLPASQSLPVTLVSPPVSTPSTVPTGGPGFFCSFDGKPWRPKPEASFQGLIIKRPNPRPELPPSELITVVLQNQSNENFLIEMPFEQGKVSAAKLTLTTKDNIAKGDANIEVEKLEGAEGKYLLSASFSAVLSELGAGDPIQLKDCSLKDLPVRALYTEAPEREE